MYRGETVVNLVVVESVNLRGGQETTYVNDPPLPLSGSLNQKRAVRPESWPARIHDMANCETRLQASSWKERQ